MQNILEWVSLIRDVGLILGIPTLIAVGVKLYSQQIEILKARNELLKETQYDRASALLESQKKVFLLEREELDRQITELKRSGSEKDETLTELNRQVTEITFRIESLNRSQELIDEANIARSLFSNDVSFRAEKFEKRIDFSRAEFNNTVSFEAAGFNSPVNLNRADLRKASFRYTDLRGVNLANAITDSRTK
jgi:predicted nuclease with TOPRIM domain